MWFLAVLALGLVAVCWLGLTFDRVSRDDDIAYFVASLPDDAFKERS